MKREHRDDTAMTPKIRVSIPADIGLRRSSHLAVECTIVEEIIR
jgi:hypothetical protein